MKSLDSNKKKAGIIGSIVLPLALAQFIVVLLDLA